MIMVYQIPINQVMSPYSKFQHGRYSLGRLLRVINPYTWILFRWGKVFVSFSALIFSYLEIKAWSKKGN